MKFPLALRLLLPAALGLATVCGAAGRSFEVTYPPSTQPGELALGVTYRLWLPDGARTLRGVIVHQHGCGEGAGKSAATAAQDLHWQALARKWDCALLGPQYHQAEKDNCRLWCDPRNGSDKTFLRALGEFAAQSGHPELAEVPWCLWGHSGGGFWSSLMLTLHPERIAAIWFRSGSAFGAWSRGEIPAPQFAPAVYGVPVMFNGGVKEVDDPKHGPARVADRAMFKMWREHGAPAGFAPDPRTGHECGDSRYLAISFLDECLALRLPEPGSRTQQLRPVEMKDAWLAPMQGEEARPASSYTADLVEAGWLPNERLAKLRAEYVKTGATGDTTPPPAPTNVQAKPNAGAIEVSWEAEADIESGLQAFIIQRDGQDLAQLPEKPAGKSARPLFQGLSYGDTPALLLPEMRYTDTTAKSGERHEYRVIAVNGVGLKSAPSAAR
jgi:poly(3-hydroxybutyrate) depolymerase